MPTGTRIWVSGHGEGWVEGYKRCPVPLHLPRSGPATYLIRFDHDNQLRNIKLNATTTNLIQLQSEHGRGSDSGEFKGSDDHSVSTDSHFLNDSDLKCQVWQAVQPCGLRAVPSCGADLVDIINTGESVSAAEGSDGAWIQTTRGWAATSSKVEWSILPPIFMPAAESTTVS